jgi:hypothetical protein
VYTVCGMGDRCIRSVYGKKHTKDFIL